MVKHVHPQDAKFPVSFIQKLNKAMDDSSYKR